MPRKPRKPPPRVYHDGLIPATPDTYHTYPEVVPDDHDQIKHEKSYPELVSPKPEPQQPQQQQAQQAQQAQQEQQRQQQQQPSAIVPPPTAHGAQHHHHHQNQLPNLAGPPLIQPLPLPRPSGVHSLRQAWSTVDESERYDALPPLDDDGHRPPLWRRPIFWVVVVALAVIAALAGILGGVASGRIKTAWERFVFFLRPFFPSFIILALVCYHVGWVRLGWDGLREWVNDVVLGWCVCAD